MKQIKLWRGGNAFRQGSLRGPTAQVFDVFFRTVLARLFYRCAFVICALYVGTCIALPRRSHLTVTQLANIRHTSQVDDLLLLFVRTQIALPCESRTTVSQIWRMSPSRLTGRQFFFIHTCFATLESYFGTIMLTVYCPFAWLSLIFLVLMNALDVACHPSFLLCMHSSHSISCLRANDTGSRLRALDDTGIMYDSLILALSKLFYITMH
jgi:hypothetical protein